MPMEITVHSSNSFARGGVVSFEKVFQTIRKGVLSVALVGTLFGSFSFVPIQAQETGDRKVKNKVSPEYPAIARRMGLTGIVRLQVVVAPNGTVKDTKVIGGHPILVNAAVDAVKKWRFEPSSGESTGTLEFKFEPGS
jgi:TonB family protein